LSSVGLRAPIVQFKTDENLPESVAALLRSAGHDVATALGEGLGGVGDSQVTAVCRREQRALLTLDRGLGDIRAYPPADYSGIVVLRTRNQEIDTLLTLVRRLIALLATRPLVGSLWIVDDRRVRIRR
jgi:predicted nuclease of predicted toxin-antitoxin system